MDIQPPAGSHYGGTWKRIIRLIRKPSHHKLSDDPNDLEALTPNHNLLLKSKPFLHPGLFEENYLYWKQVQYLSDVFWKWWIREYLPLLKERQKWTNPRAPRSSWLIGKVAKTFLDRRGAVRSVQLKTKTGFLERHITKLYMLIEACN
ncbi:hypothetical protein N1851_026916 [Merluccius polli]|uniref:DUF5641 domain-containing protein n=1 Tax=Merluccius polli TaxID=89951 RepID=A0AA47MB93_MERPO|nr:hypothetical protein N1851_026916 [Merluccius polli]